MPLSAQQLRTPDQTTLLHADMSPTRCTHSPRIRPNRHNDNRRDTLASITTYAEQNAIGALATDLSPTANKARTRCEHGRAHGALQPCCTHGTNTCGATRRGKLAPNLPPIPNEVPTWCSNGRARGALQPLRTRNAATFPHTCGYVSNDAKCVCVCVFFRDARMTSAHVW